MIGILLTNTGTPDAPTPSAVRRYLREFLSDPRVVHIPRLIWLPILYGLILPFRTSKSVALYKKIWTPQGSPMRVHMEELRAALEASLNQASSNTYCVAIGMNYGNPSIASGLEKLQEQRVKKIIVLPLFPQYSDTSTGSTIDKLRCSPDTFFVSGSLLDRNLSPRTQKACPGYTIIRDYYDHPAYVAALAESVKQHWQQHGGSERLLISFHGIPERFAAKGDPYPQQCEKTAALLAEALQLTPNQWTLCYQSQFGYDKWLKPSTQDLFVELPQQGIKTLDIICPGFAVDCLETLEEIAIRGKEMFIESGGKSLNYIPALNVNAANVAALQKLITNALSTDLD